MTPENTSNANPCHPAKLKGHGFKFARDHVDYEFYWVNENLLQPTESASQAVDIMNWQEVWDLRDALAPLSENEKSTFLSMSAVDQVSDSLQRDGLANRALSLWNQWVVPWRTKGSKVYHIASTSDPVESFWVTQMDIDRFLYESSSAYALLIANTPHWPANTEFSK